MSQCALAIYHWDRSGHKYPRRWLAKWGGLSMAHTAPDDANEWKEYCNCRTQCQNSIRPTITNDVHQWPGEVLL